MKLANCLVLLLNYRFDIFQSFSGALYSFKLLFDSLIWHLRKDQHDLNVGASQFFKHLSQVSIDHYPAQISKLSLTIDPFDLSDKLIRKIIDPVDEIVTDFDELGSDFPLPILHDIQLLHILWYYVSCPCFYPVKFLQLLLIVIVHIVQILLFKKALETLVLFLMIREEDRNLIMRSAHNIFNKRMLKVEALEQLCENLRLTWCLLTLGVILAFYLVNLVWLWWWWLWLVCRIGFYLIGIILKHFLSFVSYKPFWFSEWDRCVIREAIFFHFLMKVVILVDGRHRAQLIKPLFFL